MGVETAELDQQQLSGDGLPAPNGDGTTPADGGTPNGNASNDDDTPGDDLAISFGDDPAPNADDQHQNDATAPQWLKELRKSNREKDRRLREQEAEIARLKTASQPAQTAIVVGNEPTLEDCGYDGAKFKTELLAWNERKAKAEKEQSDKDAAAKKQNDDWNAKLQAYDTAKKALKVADIDDAEATVRATFSPVQQTMILAGLDKPELMVLALHRNAEKAKELAKIDNPAKFAVALGKLEAQMKVQPRKAAPPPERVIRGGGGAPAAIDNQLEKLRAEAAKTGDLSKVLQYKRQNRGK